jgi:carbamate kinase
VKKSILIAIGGNSLVRAGQRCTAAEQLANARFTAEQIAVLAGRGYKIVITHGNGPQVGAQLLRSELGSVQAYPLSLDLCVAMTQGEIGFVLQNALRLAFHKHNVRRPIASIVTQVVVDKNDPAFHRPTKPIGPFYSKRTAENKRYRLGWSIVEDAERGYRRVVASPLPKDILEFDVIKNCFTHGIVVIAAGGGGIPVIAENGIVHGVEAVIDKDRVSALLASRLGVEHMIISTEVPAVYTQYKKAGQEPIRKITLKEIRKLLAEKQFAAGSMKPKIEAAVDFLSAGGKTVTITDPEHLLDAFHGKAGTTIGQ